MKKILIAAAALMAVTFVAKAEYLFWQVTTQQYTDAGANSSSLYASYNDTLYYLASTQTTSGQYDVSKWTGSFSLDANGVDYYVELASYNASATPSYSAKKNAGPFKYSDLQVIDDNMLAAMRQTIQSTWSGATYNPGAVPEPTSGLMMLVGMALLGLKRRRA